MATDAAAATSASSLASVFSSWNRGPLTTTYTPPVSCLNQITVTVDITSSTTIFQGHYNWGDPSCYPPQTAATPDWTAWGEYYYSPGVICPVGWSSACSQTTSQAGNPTTLAAETSAAVCCPSGYACAGNGHQCLADLSYGQVLTKVWIVPSSSEDYSFSDGYSSISHSLMKSTITAATTMVADGIPLFYQSSDNAIFPAATTTSGATPTSSGGTSATSTSSTATGAHATAAPVSDGLSTGGKAAIGVIVPVVLIAAMLGIFFWIRRRKQRQLQVADREGLANNANEMDANSWGMAKKGPFSPVEADADATVLAELDNRNPHSYQGLPQELPLTAAHPTTTRARSPYRPRPPLHSAQGNYAPASEPLLFGQESNVDPGEEAATGPRSTTQTTMEEKEAKLERLRADIERVRAEKEQVKTLNELETMEAQLKAEILKQQRETLGF